MARYSVAGRSTVAGTAVRAIASLFGIAAQNGKVREIGVFNTTSTAVAVAVCRFTNATGVGSALTKIQYDEQGPAPGCVAWAGHTGDGAVGGNIRYASLGAAIGSGVIWTFGDTGLLMKIGTANGIGIICPTGTGQILDYYIDWDEG
jgi:hypothetical protein